jgi:benzylsuccinate CoA-transferase BbsF subunit
MSFNSNEVLKGIKVVDFTWVVVGPLTTRYLAAFGATVVKIESMRRPDLLRTSRPFKDKKPGADRSGYFAFHNSNKYSIGLNLNDANGRRVAEKLIAWADIVVENFAPGMMEKWGWSYEEIKKIRSDIIMLRTSNQGQTGPLAQQPGLGPHLIGLSGLSYYSGWPDRDPIGFGMAYTDMIAPPFGVAVLVAALDYRRRTGKGQLLDISQMETAIQFLSPQVLDYTVNGRVGNRTGNRSAYAAPHGAFPCSEEERWCVIAIFTDAQWSRFCQMVDQPWTKDAKFGTLLNRKKNEDELEKLVSGWTVNFGAEQLMNLLQKSDIPAGVVQSNEEVLNDPQLRHRNSFWPHEHKVIGPYVHLGQPFTLSKTPAVSKRPAPCLGEHTEYVCREVLGMSEGEFDQLLIEGAFDF